MLYSRLAPKLQVMLYETKLNPWRIHEEFSSISAVLLQIKLAISNLEPRPAQLARNWNV